MVESVLAMMRVSFARLALTKLSCHVWFRCFGLLSSRRRSQHVSKASKEGSPAG